MTPTKPTWDLVVVGGGTAGIIGAKTAAGLGARVALIERDRPGGDCLWTGCVPSKALLASASAAAHTRRARELGVTATAVEVDFRRVMAHIHDAVEAIAPTDSPEALRTAGVQTVHAEARFTSPRTIAAEGRTLQFHRALLATGATPTLPPTPGLPEADPWTSETIWELTRLPRRLVIIGGGTTGSELGQGFARLGSEVTIVERAPRLLPAEDPDASRIVRTALEGDGVTILTGHRLAEVKGCPRGAGEAVLVGGDGRYRLEYDILLIAIGRTPRTADLGLDVAGIELDQRGTVRVDAALRTTNRRVWAAGDLTGHPQLTHLAGVHASVAATNAVLGLRRTIDTAAIPRVTFTDPEVAAVGAPTWNDSGPAPRTVTQAHQHIDRAITDRLTAGFSRLVLGHRNRVTGATVVGPRAGESLPELTLAVRKKLTTGDLTATTHAYPTYGDGPWHAAIQDVQHRLRRPAARAAIHTATAVRRALSR
ncbi:dihydrolipoyl dehydrogenase family protein [Georgenia sp. AZ-5]|uniref:dihydrolipoyl dehydrogenase family protein n=1 Tax=Georgenia sp. AZ-5 TaxID=3367526 RepID=UPI0037542C0A